jgi:hypothetical protein
MMRAARSNGIHVPEDAIKPFRNLRDVTAKFHQDRRRLYRAFREEAPKLNPEKREEMFLRLQDDLDQSYARLMQTTQDSARDLDNVLLDAIRANAPEAHQEISAWRATVRDLRQQYMVDVQVHYRSIRGLKDEARVAAQDAFNARRLQWQNRIHMAEREGLTCLENGQAFGTAHGIDAETLGIYSKHMGAAPDTLFFEGLGETVAERTQKYVQAGYSPKMARMMAAGDVRTATVRTSTSEPAAVR